MTIKTMIQIYNLNYCIDLCSLETSPQKFNQIVKDIEEILTSIENTQLQELFISEMKLLHEVAQNVYHLSCHTPVDNHIFTDAILNLKTIATRAFQNL